MGLVPVHLGLMKSTILDSYPGYALQFPPLADPISSLEDCQLTNRRTYRDDLYVCDLTDDLEVQDTL